MYNKNKSNLKGGIKNLLNFNAKTFVKDNYKEEKEKNCNKFRQVKFK